MQGKPSLWDVIKSVLAAMFGVQKGETRERDFSTGNPWVFIVVGIVMTVLLVLAIVTVVKVVLVSSR